jgi:hypothetical protein
MAAVKHLQQRRIYSPAVRKDRRGVRVEIWKKSREDMKEG